MCKKPSLLVKESKPMTKNKNNQTLTSKVHVKKTLSMGKKELRLLTLNVCGLKSKLKGFDFENFIMNYDIVALSETKLSNLDDISIPHFHIFSLNGFNSRCSGGIAILLKKDLKEYVKILPTPSKCVLWCMLSKELLGFKTLIGAVYIPPYNSKYSDISFFDDLMKMVLATNNHYLCVKNLAC